MYCSNDAKIRTDCGRWRQITVTFVVARLADVELDQGVDAIIHTHAAFQDLLCMQRCKVEA